MKEYYWDDTGFIYLDRNMLESINFSLVDIDTLSKEGLPAWVAPNINFDIYDVVGQSLKLGEDRDDNDIFISLPGHIVYVGHPKLVMNTSPVKLRATLVLYAEMVEKMYLIDQDAMINNQINPKFIEEFKSELGLLDPIAIQGDTFWNREIYRLFKDGKRN